jgi:hypothetical protein
MGKRGWFAEPLGARATQAVRRLLILARQWAAPVGQPVRAWRSDTQDACVTAMADACVGVPPRDCHTPFRREVAPPVRDLARPAQVTRRRTVRGLRAIARRVLAGRRQVAPPEPPLPQASPQGDGTPWSAPSAAATAAPWAPGARGVATPGHARVADEAGAVGRGDGAAGRGRLSARQGGPRRPPG